MHRRLAAAAFLPLTFLAADCAFAAEPRLGRTAVLTPQEGTVLIKPPGRWRFAPVRNATSIPIGTAVDLRQGSAGLLMAKDKRGRTQAGDFNGGAFIVKQTRRSPSTTLRLIDVTKGVCPSAARTATGVFASGSTRRRLFGSARGRFRTRGRHATASIRGTTWITEDTCTGSTRITAVEGQVMELRKGDDQLVGPGQTAEDFCDETPSRRIRAVASYYCWGVLYGQHDADTRARGFPDFVSFILDTRGFDVKRPPASAEACVTPLGAEEHCTSYRIEDPSLGALLDDACSLVQDIPSYRLRWRLRGIFLPPAMTISNAQPNVHPRLANGGCLNRPTFPPYDEPVSEPGNEFEPR